MYAKGLTVHLLERDGFFSKLVAEGLGCEDFEVGAIGPELLNEIESRRDEPLEDTGFGFGLRCM